MALLLGAIGYAQTRPAWIQDRFENLDFAAGGVGEMPPGWRLGPEGTPVYAARIAAGASCQGGKPCGKVQSVGMGPHNSCFLYQVVDATPYRGKMLAYRAAVRAEVTGAGVARLLVRIHREDGSTSLRDDMGPHPITSSQWNFYEIDVPIVADARDIEFGMQLFGEGAAWIDKISLTFSAGEAEKAIREVFGRFTEARDARDGKAMAATYSEDAEYIAFNGVRVKGRSNLEEMWSGAPGQPRRTIQSVELLTPDMAVMRVVAEFDDPAERLNETFLLVREGGEWKIRVHQAMKS